MNSNTLSIGENLKSIRQFFNLKQSDIAGEHITRNLISLIENNKTPLHEKTARLISDNINAHMEQRHSLARTSIQDIMVPGIFNAKIEADRLIVYLKDNGNDIHFNLDAYLKKLNGFYASWDLPDKKYQNYFMLGTYFENLNKLDRSYLYYSLAYENAIRLDNKDSLGHIASALTTMSLLLNNIDSVIILSDVIKPYGDSIKQDDMVLTLINEALGYYFMNNYERSIDALLQAEHYISGPQSHFYLELQILKTHLYMKKKMMGIASRILKNLNHNKHNLPLDHHLLIDSCNLLLQCLLNNKITDTQEYDRIKSQLNLIDEDSKFYVGTLNHLGQVALLMNVTEEYYHITEQVLTLCQKNNYKILFTYFFHQVFETFRADQKMSFQFIRNICLNYLNSDLLSPESGIHKQLLKICIENHDYDLINQLLH